MSSSTHLRPSSSPSPERIVSQPATSAALAPSLSAPAAWTAAGGTLPPLPGGLSPRGQRASPSRVRTKRPVSDELLRKALRNLPETSRPEGLDSMTVAGFQAVVGGRSDSSAIKQAVAKELVRLDGSLFNGKIAQAVGAPASTVTRWLSPIEPVKSKRPAAASKAQPPSKRLEMGGPSSSTAIPTNAQGNIPQCTDHMLREVLRTLRDEVPIPGLDQVTGASFLSWTLTQPNRHEMRQATARKLGSTYPRLIQTAIAESAGLAQSTVSELLSDISERHPWRD